MKYALILLMLPSIAMAHSEKECNDRLLAKTKMKREYFTKMITVCSVKVMEGFTVYLDHSPAMDRVIRRRYPSESHDLVDQTSATQMERAQRLQDYNTCEHVTSVLSEYMRTCLKEK